MYHCKLFFFLWEIHLWELWLISVEIYSKSFFFSWVDFWFKNCILKYCNRLNYFCFRFNPGLKCAQQFWELHLDFTFILDWILPWCSLAFSLYFIAYFNCGNHDGDGKTLLLSGVTLLGWLNQIQTNGLCWICFVVIKVLRQVHSPAPPQC